MSVGNVFGYDTYMICENSLTNVVEDGVVTGFSVDLRIANYRGYLLSQIEDVQIVVDGEKQARADLTFILNGKAYALDDMETVIDDRWGILDVVTLFCRKPGGLSAGSHEIYVEEHVRASYIPMIAVSSATRAMDIAA